jgi:RNA polymerase sigma-70 factor (ECF subfamily)
MVSLTCYDSLDTETPLADLVGAAQEGCREALDEIVRRYQRLVHSIALRRLGNESDAQELTQEVFVQLLRKIGQLREPAALGGWLRSITHRLAINRLARARHEVAADQETLEAHGSDSAETPLARVLREERSKLVQQGLARLGTLDRDTLIAFYVSGQSLAEMSDSFRSPVGTIKRRLHVARKRLARELEACSAL